MRRSRAKPRLVVLLGLVCLLLAWVIYEQVAEIPAIQAVKPSDVAEAGAAAIQRSEAATFSVPDRQSLAVILERPLFTQTRRPSGIAAGSTQGMAVDFSLSGVVISGGVRSALIRSGTNGVVQQLKIGDAIGGWTLVEVAADRVVVRRDTVEAEVFLDYAAPAPPVPRTEIPMNMTKDPTARSNEDERQMNETGDTKSGETSSDD